MVLADEEPGTDAQPHWYARVIGIFHVNVFTLDPTRQHHQMKLGGWMFYEFVGLVMTPTTRAIHSPSSASESDWNFSMGVRVACLDFWTQIKSLEPLTSCLHSRKGVLENFWVLP